MGGVDDIPVTLLDIEGCNWAFVTLLKAEGCKFIFAVGVCWG